MSRLLRVVLPLLAAGALAVPALADTAPATQTFGVAITHKKSVDLDRLARAPHKFKGRTVRVEGIVHEVCQGRGCWIEIGSAHGTTFLAKSLDESVLVPKDCKGQKVVVQGVVTTLPAADAAEGEEGHACPKPTWVVSMLGVELTPPVR
jgi:hypothetical protein